MTTFSGKPFRAPLAALAVLGLAGASHAQYLFGSSGTNVPSDGNTQLILNGGSVVLNSYGRGWYDNAGFNNTANDNYIVGNAEGGLYRDFFVFSLGNVGAITDATLKLYNPAGGYFSNNPNELFYLFDVSTDLTSLLNGTGGVGAYNDFATGVSYGSLSVDSSADNHFVQIPLNANALAALNNAAGNAGNFAIGGTMDLSANATAPEPSSLALLALGAAGFAIRRVRRKLA